MKTRILRTKLKADRRFQKLSSQARLLLLTLYTSPLLSLTECHEIPDTYLCAESALTTEELGGAKEEIESQKLAFFKDGFVWLPAEFTSRYDSGKSAKAFRAEVAEVPKEVLDYFRSLDSTIVGTMYSTPKPKTLKQKTENRKQKTEGGVGGDFWVPVQNEFPWLDVERLARKFTSYNKARGKQFADETEELRRWAENETDRNPELKRSWGGKRYEKEWKKQVLPISEEERRGNLAKVRAAIAKGLRGLGGKTDKRG